MTKRGIGGLVSAACLLLCASRARHGQAAEHPVTEGEAKESLAALVALASKQTAGAMDAMCEMSADDCAGFSGAVRTDRSTMPAGGSAPEVLCSRDVGAGSWMLVINGEDGLGRPYTSQVVFGRDGDRVVPVREPAFWLGIGYTSDKVTGSTTWSAAYAASGSVAREHTAKILGRARAACA